MSPEQRDYVFMKTKGIIPNVEVAYRAAKNAEKFANLSKDTAQNK